MRSIIGRSRVMEEVPDILYDESRFTLGVPNRVCFPENTDDVITCIRDAQNDDSHITIIGGKTGITGGSVPTEGCCALCFSAMQRILRVEIDASGRPILFCQPGVTLEEIALFCNDPDAYHYPVDGQNTLKGKTWFYPPDPTEMTAQLGGTVATNASGARSFKYGPTRNHIQQVSLVLANSDTITLVRGKERITHGSASIKTDQGHILRLPPIASEKLTIKNAAGYYLSPEMDLIDLFIGSEGSLAIFVEIGVRLSPLPEIKAGLSFFPCTYDAFHFADYCRSLSNIVAIEYFDATALDFVSTHSNRISLTLPEYPSGSRAAVYWEYSENGPQPFEKIFEVFEEALAKYNGSLDMTWSGFNQQEQSRLRNFRHAVPELINQQVAFYKRTDPAIRKISTDAAVPAEQFIPLFDEFTRMITDAGLEHVIFGHLGDYHLHINLLPHTSDELVQARSLYEKMMALVIAKGGTVSAEHGIGKLKTCYLEKMYPPAVLDEMKAVKNALDPSGLLNPGNIFKKDG